MKNANVHVLPVPSQRTDHEHERQQKQGKHLLVHGIRHALVDEHVKTHGQFFAFGPLAEQQHSTAQHRRPRLQQSFSFDNGLVNVRQSEVLVKLLDRDGKEIDFGLFFRHSGQGAQQSDKLHEIPFLHVHSGHVGQDFGHRRHGFNGRHGVEFADPQQVLKDLAILPADHDRVLRSGVVDRELKQRVVEGGGAAVVVLKRCFRRFFRRFFRRVGNSGGGGCQPFLVVQQLQPSCLHVPSLGVPLRERFEGDAAAAVAVLAPSLRSGLSVCPRLVRIDRGDNVMAGRVDDAIEGGITGT